MSNGRVRSGRDSLTVLIADDQELPRRLATQFLERLGFNVLQVENGARAVDLYRERAGEISLVLLDLRMPVMGGAEALRMILEHDAEARILMWSGDATDEEVHELLSAGAVDFLAKPLAFDTLVTAVKDALGSYARLITPSGLILR